jgi:Fe-S oxidoreductase
MMLFTQDVMGMAVLIAIIIASYRRFILKPKHTMLSMDALVINCLIGGLMLTKFMANGAEITLIPQPDLGHNPLWTPISHAVSHGLGGPGTGDGSMGLWAIYHANYWAHIGIVLFFLNYIPFGKHLHLLGAMPNVFFRKFEPKGSFYVLDMEDEDAEKFGVSEVEELSWKQLLDVYACTECGRCENYCPAYNSGKPLNPMMIVHKIKDHLKEKGENKLKGTEGHITGAFSAGEGSEFPSLVGGVISAEELWACTTCGACVGNCPVFIEHVDTIVDMRRYLVLTESAVSPEVVNTFKNIESNSNPWGLSASYRADWAEGLDIPLWHELDEPPEYLFFVGCAGSFDDRQKKVSQSLSRVLKAAGVSFAILGGKEKCTGDPVRRIGNEYLYQQCATANIETLNKNRVSKIITACPHCFHTIGKEYPQLGGEYEVFHHTEVIAELIRTGRIKMDGSLSGKFTYHDSCYIGRWADIYDPPRDIIDAVPGATRAEADLNRRKSFCCGAGGGRMWMEEDLGKRVNYERTDQLLDTEPDVVAVGCPFCLTMMDDGIKFRGADDVKLMDLAEIVDANLN